MGECVPFYEIVILQRTDAPVPSARGVEQMETPFRSPRSADHTLEGIRQEPRARLPAQTGRYQEGFLSTGCALPRLLGSPGHLPG